MTQARIAELLAELEVSPQETTWLDLEPVLVATNHEQVPDDDGLVVFVHREWEFIWTFDRQRRWVPVGYVLAIVRAIRAKVNHTGRRP